MRVGLGLFVGVFVGLFVGLRVRGSTSTYYGLVLHPGFFVGLLCAVGLLVVVDVVVGLTANKTHAQLIVLNIFLSQSNKSSQNIVLHLLLIVR